MEKGYDLMFGGPLITESRIYGRPFRRPYGGSFRAPFFGVPFVSGLLGGVLGSALFNPYTFGGYPYPYSYPYYGVPYSPYGGYWY